MSLVFTVKGAAVVLICRSAVAAKERLRGSAALSRAAGRSPVYPLGRDDDRGGAVVCVFGDRWSARRCRRLLN